jgi:putative Mn2+ efflux pump MntP
MSPVELLAVAVGLSMDAFAISVCIGLSGGRSFKDAATAGAYFGISQAVMPIAGWWAGSRFAGRAEAYGGWIAFVILGVIGAKMIRDGLDKTCAPVASLKFRAMFPLAIATSIDAMAAGVSLALVNANIALSAAVIGWVAFALSIAGVKAGTAFGAKFKSRAELAGGVILILMGAKLALL